jgi:hypothetical protein
VLDPVRASALAFLLVSKPRILGRLPIVLAGCLLPACALTKPPPDYQGPAKREPHAVVKVRLAYHAWPGPELEQRVDIDGRVLGDIPAPARRGDGVATRVALVRPGPVAWAIQTTFFHNDVTSHAETYDTTEAAPCGTTTCMQIHPHTRLVNKIDRVNDAACSQGMKFQAKAGETYVLEYDFEADKKCTLVCHRQVHGAKGSPATASCETAAGIAGKR